MKRFKVGVIGIGGIARTEHLPALLKSELAEVTAVCDIKPEKMDFELVPKKAVRYTDYRRLLKEADVDAVHICTPNYLHSEIAEAALLAGKHTFCEKPDAVNVAEAERMKAAAERSGMRLMVMRNNRFTDGSKLLKRMSENGEFGDIYSARCGWIRRRGIPGRGGWFTTKAQSGGGPLIDLGVHMIDLAIYLMGNPKPVAVSGAVYEKFANSSDSVADSVHATFGERVANGTFDVEDNAMGFIRFDNGACLQIEFSWASNVEKEMNFVELRGDKAGAVWNGGEVKIFGERQGRLTDEIPALAPYSGHTAAIEHFYRVLTGEESAIYDIEQGIDMIKILTAIYKSAESGREVVL